MLLLFVVLGIQCFWYVLFAGFGGLLVLCDVAGYLLIPLFARARARKTEKSKRAAAPPDCYFNQFAKIEATFMNQGLTRSLDESETVGKHFRKQ